MTKVKVRNVSNGPRGLYVAGKADPVMFDTGPEFEEVDMDDGEIAAAKKTGWFEFKGGTDKAEPEKSGK